MCKKHIFSHIMLNPHLPPPNGMMKSELLGYIPFSFLSLQILPIDSFFYILNSIYYGATMFVMVIILKNQNISMGEGRVTYDDFMLISFLLHTDDPSTKKIRLFFEI